jgi:hypothetical protein
VSGRTALVTGASGGLGREFAQLFAADGFDVALVARTGAALEDLAQDIETRHRVVAHVLPIDLAHPGAPSALLAELGLRGVPIDALVNGAALHRPGSFLDADETELLDTLQVNLAALAHLTRLVLPGMVERGWGRIVNFSSADALRLGSRRALPRAAEAFVLSFSLALADELRGSGVRATAVCLPPTLQAPSARAALGAGTSAPAETDFAEIATWGFGAVKRGRPLAVRGMRWQARAVGTRLLPAAVAASIHRSSRRTPNSTSTARSGTR